jgi:hypothetical protein
MDWCLAGAKLWAEPPRHIHYVQPHAFLLPYYCAAEYSHMDITTIEMAFDAGATLQWTIDCVKHGHAYHISHPALLHPPALVSESYLQYLPHSHSFSLYWLLWPSIDGMDIWEDAYEADASVARHAAMHMMMLYYHQGLTSAEEVLPHGNDTGMEEVVEVVEVANEMENSMQNSVPPTSHAYVLAPPFLGSTSSSEAVMYDLPEAMEYSVWSPAVSVRALTKKIGPYIEEQDEL